MSAAKTTVVVCGLALVLTLACGDAAAKGSGGRSKGGGGHATSTRSAGDSHAVRGHVTKRGTYVQPHHATNPDGTTRNNWSHKGNVNPHTGKAGTKKD